MKNPFNIRYTSYNKWVGQLNPVNGFCRFASLSYGVRAFAILYRTYINKYHVTVLEFVSRYAPQTENDTEAYVRTVCRLTGFAPGYRLTPTDLVLFGAAVHQVEQGFVRADIVELLKKYTL